MVQNFVILFQLSSRSKNGVFHPFLIDGNSHTVNDISIFGLISDPFITLNYNIWPFFMKTYPTREVLILVTCKLFSSRVEYTLDKKYSSCIRKKKKFCTSFKFKTNSVPQDVMWDNKAPTPKKYVSKIALMLNKFDIGISEFAYFHSIIDFLIVNPDRCFGDTSIELPEVESNRKEPSGKEEFTWLRQVPLNVRQWISIGKYFSLSTQTRHTETLCSKRGTKQFIKFSRTTTASKFAEQFYFVYSGYNIQYDVEKCDSLTEYHMNFQRICAHWMKATPSMCYMYALLGKCHDHRALLLEPWSRPSTIKGQ